MRILFGGDFAPVRRYEACVLDTRLDVFREIQFILDSVDYAVCNLECPLSDHSIPIRKVGPNHRANPRCINAICNRRFDACSLANNHIFDFGATALQDTLNLCNTHGVLTFGAGMTDQEIKKPLIIKKNGSRIAIVGMAEQEFNSCAISGAGVNILDPVKAFYAYTEAKMQSDFVVFFLHAGNEFLRIPRPKLRLLCRYLIDLGSHAVVCSHSHVPGAFEIYRNRPIVYGLGNLIFDRPNPPPLWDVGYLAILEPSSKQTGVEIIPFRQSVEQCGVSLLRGEDRKKFFDDQEKLTRILKYDHLFFAEWNLFVESKKADLAHDLFFPSRIPLAARLERLWGISRFLVPYRTLMRRLNQVRCPSHRELCVSVLERSSKTRDEPTRFNWKK